MMTFYFKVLTFPRSVPMRIVMQLPNEFSARIEARTLYQGTGEGPGTWVKVYASDPDDNWLRRYETPTPVFELPGGAK